MKNIFEFLRFSTKKTKLSIMYVISVMIILSAFSFIMINFNVPLFIVISISWIVGCASICVNFRFVPTNNYLSKKEMITYLLGRMFYNIFVYIFIMIATSLGLNLVTSGIIFTIFAKLPDIGIVINEVVLYILSTAIFARVTLYNGFNDTTHKRYNPHIMLQSGLFIYAFMFPFAYGEFVQGNAMISRSQFFLTQIVVNLNLGIIMFFIGFAVLTTITAVIMLYYYSEGRRNFFVKHPNNLEYDKKEVNEFLETN